MPCYSSKHYLSDNRTLSEQTISSLKEDVAKKDEKISYLTAIICALNNEIYKSINYEEIISNAEKNGQIKIKEFIKVHNEEDESRLKDSLDKTYSVHELKMIKEILNKTDI